MKTDESPAEPIVEVESPSLALAMAARAPDPAVLSVLSVEHPTLVGRVCCGEEGAKSGRWLPTLAGLSVRPGDRVLVLRPQNFAEAIVVGVLDGLGPRARPTAERGPRLSMLPDEALRIETQSGEPIVEVRVSEVGPVVRLLSADVTIETEGRLRFSAATIELEARQGAVKVEASDDVVVQGETIHLN